MSSGIASCRLDSDKLVRRNQEHCCDFLDQMFLLYANEHLEVHEIRMPVLLMRLLQRKNAPSASHCLAKQGSGIHDASAFANDQLQNRKFS